MIKIQIPKYLFAAGFHAKCKIDRMRYKEIPEIFDLGGKIRYEDCYAIHLDNRSKIDIYLTACSQIELGYQEMLAKCAELIKSIKPNPTLEEILYIYIYLYRKGYLSATNDFKFDFNTNEVEIRNGLTVTTGKAVCRNIATMFSDLLLHFNTFSFGVTTDGLAESRETIMLSEELMKLKNDGTDDNEYNKNFNERSQKVGIDDHITGNHVEVLAQSNDEWYLLDPSAFSISQIIDTDNGHPMRDVFRPWSLLAYGYYNTGDVIEVYRQFRDKYIKQLSDKRNIHLQQDMYYLCEDSKIELDSFSQDTSYQKQLIKTWLEKI